MGSGEVDPLPDGFQSRLKPLTFGEQLDEWCAYYMAIGVTYDEFWYGDYCRLKYYVERFRIQKKTLNEMLWLMGAYNYEGHGIVLANAFSKHSNLKYPEKPYDVVEKTEREKEIEKEEKLKKVIANLNRLKKDWDEHHAEDSRTDNRDKE